MESTSLQSPISLIQYIYMNTPTTPLFSLYQQGNRIASFSSVPDAEQISTFLRSSKNIHVDATAPIELRRADTNEVLFTLPTTTGAVWNTANGTMPKWMKWIFGDANTNQIPDPLEGLLDGLLANSTPINTPNDTTPHTTSIHSHTSHELDYSTQIQGNHYTYKNPSPDAIRSAQSNILRIVLCILGLSILAKLLLF